MSMNIDHKKALALRGAFTVCTGDAKSELFLFLQELNKNGYAVVPLEPSIAQKRALIKAKGYDPDAKEGTLDMLGRLDIMTMGAELQRYREMVLAETP